MFTDEELKKIQNKKSFIIQKSLEIDMENMTDAEVKYLMMTIFSFVSRGELRDLSHPENRVVKIAFDRFMEDYKRDSEAWIESIRQRSKGGKRSAEIRREQKENPKSV